MAGSLNEVLQAVAEPDLVFRGEFGELFAAVFKRRDKALLVIYKEEGDEGFIITAFFTKRIKQLLKREIVWNKLKQPLSYEDLEKLLEAI